MLYVDLAKALIDYLRIVEDCPAISVMQMLSEIGNAVLPLASDVLADTSNDAILAKRNSFHSKLRAGITSMKSIRIFDLALSIQAMQKASFDLNTALNKGQEELLPPNVSRLDEFQSLFQNFKTDHAYLDAIRLVFFGKELYASFQSQLETIRLALRSVSLPESTSKGQQELVIKFEEALQLDEVISKLTSLSRIYAAICQILDIRTSDFPLEIRKIETGSLVTDLLGAKPAINLIKSLIYDTTSFILKRWTRDGKIESIPNRLEVIKNILEKSDKLRELGIQTTGIDQRAQELADEVATEMGSLLRSNRSIEVDGKTIGVPTQIVPTLPAARTDSQPLELPPPTSPG